jgi:hypothetical protein
MFSGFSKCRRDLRWPSTKARRTEEKKQQTMEEATGSAADGERCSWTCGTSISKSNIPHMSESSEDSILRPYGDSNTVTQASNDVAWQEVPYLRPSQSSCDKVMSRAERWCREHSRTTKTWGFKTTLNSKTCLRRFLRTKENFGPNFGTLGESRVDIDGPGGGSQGCVGGPLPAMQGSDAEYGHRRVKTWLPAVPPAFKMS